MQFPKTPDFTLVPRHELLWNLFLIERLYLWKVFNLPAMKMLKPFYNIKDGIKFFHNNVYCAGFTLKLFWFHRTVSYKTDRRFNYEEIWNESSINGTCYYVKQLSFKIRSVTFLTCVHLHYFNENELRLINSFIVTSIFDV